ncbi:helix-turn-helix transcriptional regulator [Halovivax cerinus]|uniref:Helix-turn-helix transcriptional regulator n=1 Tax=Halovivax cerinus TaxID=1487865 RepID=A0ABD5NPW9_9EURY|nr:helix-turn-helix domain-containing protein [Halovivax cerinus]
MWLLIGDRPGSQPGDTKRTALENLVETFPIHRSPVPRRDRPGPEPATAPRLSHATPCSGDGLSRDVVVTPPHWPPGRSPPATGYRRGRHVLFVPDLDRLRAGVVAHRFEPVAVVAPERVLDLLEANGGRIRQAEIAEECDWSASKTSRVVGELVDEGVVEKLQLGRENLVSMPDEDE